MFTDNNIQGSFLQRLNIIVDRDICKEQLHEVSRKQTTDTEETSLLSPCALLPLLIIVLGC